MRKKTEFDNGREFIEAVGGFVLSNAVDESYVKAHLNRPVFVVGIGCEYIFNAGFGNGLKRDILLLAERVTYGHNEVQPDSNYVSDRLEDFVSYLGENSGGLIEVVLDRDRRTINLKLVCSGVKKASPEVSRRGFEALHRAIA